MAALSKPPVDGISGCAYNEEKSSLLATFDAGLDRKADPFARFFKRL
jgi:hypothetical protein